MCLLSAVHAVSVLDTCVMENESVLVGRCTVMRQRTLNAENAENCKAEKRLV